MQIQWNVRKYLWFCSFGYYSSYCWELVPLHVIESCQCWYSCVPVWSCCPRRGWSIPPMNCWYVCVDVVFCCTGSVASDSLTDAAAQEGDEESAAPETDIKPWVPDLIIVSECQWFQWVGRWRGSNSISITVLQMLQCWSLLLVLQTQQKRGSSRPMPDSCMQATYTTQV